MRYRPTSFTPGVTIVGVKELVVDAHFWTGVDVADDDGTQTIVTTIDVNGMQTEARVKAGLIETPPHYRFDCKIKLRLGHEHFDLVAMQPQGSGDWIELLS